MDKPISSQQLAVVPVRRMAAKLGPAQQGGPPSGPPPKAMAADHVTISAAGRARGGGAAAAANLAAADAQPTARERQMQQALDGLRGAFHTQAGDDDFDASYDFNRDGVINAGDLGMLREKFAGGASGPVRDPQPTQSEPAAPPTLQELRDAFYTRSGDEGFNAAADLNSDGVINAGDLAMYRRSMSAPVMPPQMGGNGPDKGDMAQPTQPVPGVIESVTAPDPAPAAATVPVKTAEPDATQPVVDAAGTTAPGTLRDNVLAQLRAAFFSAQGDDRFDATLDSNGDGRINVADFAAARFASSDLDEA